MQLNYRVVRVFNKKKYYNLNLTKDCCPIAFTRANSKQRISYFVLLMHGFCVYQYLTNHPLTLELLSFCPSLSGVLASHDVLYAEAGLLGRGLGGLYLLWSSQRRAGLDCP